MPELPEVETTKRGLIPHIDQQTVKHVVIRQPSLRWPVREDLNALLKNQQLLALDRRAKYLLFRFKVGTLIAHLGMSGSMRIVSPGALIKKHDHIDIIFENQKVVRYNDPRRFGAMLWSAEPVELHPLLAKLGPEPLDNAFDAALLLNKAFGRKINIKQLIMNQHVVVGVGNIYANEALFMAGVHPLKPAHELTQPQAVRLVEMCKTILQRSITQGGTTLRDFVNSDGKPGYFKQSLLVYGRENEPCTQCMRPLELIRINNRATVFCANCQQ